MELRVHARKREQLGDTGDRPAADRTANVIRVVMRDEHSGEAHTVGGEQLDELGGRVRGVHCDRVAGLSIADEVHEVDHLPGDLVGLCEVSACE